MSFSRWLRHNTEHYLLIAAQDRVARQHGARRPRRPHGLRDLFWLRFFDRLIPADYTIDAACGVYFLGEKRSDTISEEELVTYYSGALR